MCSGIKLRLFCCQIVHGGFKIASVLLNIRPPTTYMTAAFHEALKYYIVYFIIDR